MKSARETGEGMPMPELPYPNVFGAKAMPKSPSGLFSRQKFKVVFKMVS
jgi:hypothetical protein